MKSKVVSTAALTALALVSELTSADVLATRTRTSAFSLGVVPPVVSVPLNNAGATTVPFVTTMDNQRVVISYNAECSVTDNLNSNVVYLNTDIVVDFGTASAVTAIPTNDDNAFCTSDDQAGGNWVAATAIGVVVVPDAGLHTATVRANLAGGGAGDGGSLDDSTIVVQY